MAHSDYVLFRFTANNRSYAFKTYNDEMGNEVGFVIGHTKEGNPIYHRWKFDKDTQRISVHKNKTDRKGLSAVDFLRNSPNCKGSPRGAYGHDGTQIDYYFEEINDAKSASEGLAFEKLVLDAQNLALKLKGQEFIDMCALIGVMDKDESVMQFSLLVYAKNKPQSFMDFYNDPTRKVRSLIRQALHSNIFVKDGGMITWENKFIGANEDDAVGLLMRDEVLQKAIQKNLEKTKV